ncbi:hypothetical protein DFJ73DRAFT_815973 [Zopfochytrium polystomum]|nr:hypothetical protein DFJ73DRAFT_815973 [Zopfochytrium polystomum]
MATRSATAAGPQRAVMASRCLVGAAGAPTMNTMSAISGCGLPGAVPTGWGGSTVDGPYAARKSERWRKASGAESISKRTLRRGSCCDFGGSCCGCCCRPSGGASIWRSPLHSCVRRCTFMRQTWRSFSTSSSILLSRATSMTCSSTSSGNLWRTFVTVSGGADEGGWSACVWSLAACRWRPRKRDRR